VTVRPAGPLDTSNAANAGGSVSNTSLNQPIGVAVDSDPSIVGGGLYIAENGNQRVLHFSGKSTIADRVYGQPDFTSNQLEPAESR
jgi:hypothetical protein